MPRRKTTKRARPEDADQDLSQPIAKRINQMDLNSSAMDLNMQHGNDQSTVQLLPPHIDESCRRPVGFEPTLPEAYDPELPATDNPFYYQVNKVLFEAHLQWIQRRQPRDL